jgi:hypothetical protein
VFASGHAARQALDDLSDAPDLIYIQKPWTVPELAATLRAAFEAPAPGSASRR